MKSPSAWVGGRPDIREAVGAWAFSLRDPWTVWPAMGVEPGPKVPTMPPFSYRGGKSSPAGKMSKVDRHIMGNSLLLMSLNFQCEFYNFYAIALDVIEPLE